MKDTDDSIEESLYWLADRDVSVRPVDQALESRMINEFSRRCLRTHRRAVWLIAGTVCLAIGGAAVAANRNNITRWFLLDPSDAGAETIGDGAADYILLEPEDPEEDSRDQEPETATVDDSTGWVEISP